MYREKRYGAVKTGDFKQWEVVSDQLKFPPGARHGTILAITNEVLEKLKSRPAGG